MAILSAATGQAAATGQERLFYPIGAADTRMANDPAGNTRLSSSIQTTCQDAARFGYLFARRGNWDDDQVVSEGWVRNATGEPSQDLFAAYGYLWWLNRPSDFPLDAGAVELFADHAAAVDGQRQLVPGAPDDMYWAVGAFGQIIQVHPTPTRSSSGSAVPSLRDHPGHDFPVTRPRW
ncbi:MAG: hypothetical protein ACRDZN_06195 [Acidimicrobiales bacterium]